MKTTRAILSSTLIGAMALAPAAAHADEPPTFTPHFTETQHFTIDPVVDGILIAGGAGFSLLLGAVLSTGEITPTPVTMGAKNRLLSIDQGAVNQTVDPNAGGYSDIGLYAAIGYAVLDPVLSGVKDGWRSGLIDGVMYAESIAIISAFTDATKIGVRRPRPRLTLAIGTLLTTFVSYERSAPASTSRRTSSWARWPGPGSACWSRTSTAARITTTRSTRPRRCGSATSRASKAAGLSASA
jgi:hypothetical protein